MKFLNKNIKLIVGIIVGMLLVSGISVYATYKYFATDVSYMKSGTEMSVAEALNELYANKKETTDSTKEITTNGEQTLDKYYKNLNVNVTTDKKYTEQEYQNYGQEQYTLGISANANLVANTEGYKTGVYQGTIKQSYWIECGFKPRYIVISLETVGSNSNDAVFYYKEGISSTNSYMVQISNSLQTTYAMEGKYGTIADNAKRHIYGVSDDGFGFYFSSSTQKIYYTAFK